MMSPCHTLFLFRAENSPSETLAPLSEAFPPLPYFLGPCKTPAPSSSSCAARSCRSRQCRSCEARRRSAPARICDCRRRGCPRRTAPAPRVPSVPMIWGGSGRHGIRPCWRPASRMPSWRPSNVRRPSRTRASRLGLSQEAPDFFQYRGLLAELPFSFLSFGIS